MKQATLVYLLKSKQVLLAMKKRGFGAGKLNGIGGKVNENETPEQAAIRETAEEICVEIKPTDLKKIGELDFFFSGKQDKSWDQTVHIFAARKWSNEPTETEEMKPVWINNDKLPFKKMWKDDPFWMQLLLKEKKFKGKFVFDEDNESIKEQEIFEL
jgi:8-oxo-dGTP pyrophosphatase MutT (NUDIX family)